MEGTCAAGNRKRHPEGETPKTSSSVGYAGTCGVERRKAPERLPDAARTPRKLRVSRDPLVPGLAEHPEVPVRRIMARPDAEDRSARGDQRERKLLRRPGDDVLRRGLLGSGTTAVGPGRTGTSAFETAELSTSYSSEFETVEHRGRRGARDAATRFRPSRPKELSEREPRERQRT